jgi:hypothetical protein
VPAVGQTELRFHAGKIVRRNGGPARPRMFGQRKITMNECDCFAEPRQDFFVHHAAEGRAIRAFEVFIDHHPDSAVLTALDQRHFGG